MTSAPPPAASGVYRIVCDANGKAYVGSSVDMRVRWKLHRTCLRAGRHINPHLQYAWNKYGEGAFRFEVAELVPVELLLDTEQRHIDECPARFNIRLDARSNRGLRPSAETKAKIRAANLGRFVSAESRARMSTAQRGRVMSREAVEKSRAAHIGLKHTEEAKEKIRAASRRRTGVVNG